MASDTQDFDNAVTIVGSTVNVPITIAGTSVTLSVSITAASVTLNMNFTGQTTAVFSGSQYAITLGNGIYVNGTAVTNIVLVQTATYVVPAAKTFYMQGFTYGCNTNVAYITLGAQIRDGVTTIMLCAVGAGAITPLDEPIPFATGHTVSIWTNYINAGGTNATMWASFWGWLG